MSVIVNHSLPIPGDFEIQDGNHVANRYGKRLIIAYVVMRYRIPLNKYAETRENKRKEVGGEEGYEGGLSC